MWLPTAFSRLKFMGLALTATLLLTGSRAAHSQARLPFDGLDWLVDRGTPTVNDATGNYLPFYLRPGYNLFTDPATNPGTADQRWVFPRTTDTGLYTNGLNGQTNSQTLNEIVDNPNTNDPNVIPNTGGVRQAYPTVPDPTTILPASLYATRGQYVPQSFFINGTGGITLAWAIPDQLHHNSTQGYSLGTGDQTQNYFNDYGVVPSTLDRIPLTDPTNGQTRIATAAELSSLPSAQPYVYSAVNTELTGVGEKAPHVYWRSGSYLLPQPTTTGGTTPVRVEIHSPGDGTLTGPVIDNGDGTFNTSGAIAHPNPTRVFVRVSWGNTVDNGGNIITGATGIDDPLTSRIFMVDLEQQGWQTLVSDGTDPNALPAAIPYTGLAGHQIVVTLYTLTPDDPTDTNDPTSGDNSFLVCADAVRFTPLGNGVPNTTGTGSDNLLLSDGNYIPTTGRILGPVVGTSKVTTDFNGTGAGGTNVEPLFYFAREEEVPDPTLDAPLDPTKPYDPTTGVNVGVNPIRLTSVPVFYCIDNRPNQDVQRDAITGQPTLTNGNGTVLARDSTLPVNVPSQFSSSQKVRWRFVGYPEQQLRDPNLPENNDPTSGTAYNPRNMAAPTTSAASPVLANVRTRNGAVIPMVYFITYTTTGALGRIYALDAYGDRDSTITNTASSNYQAITTRVYWTYPSARAHLQDPNYAILASGAPNALPSAAVSTTGPFGADQLLPYPIFDGIIDRRNNPQSQALLVNTQVNFAGSHGSPVVIDDPDAKNINPTTPGPQMLVVGDNLGRVFALDAGGRGDYTPGVPGPLPTAALPANPGRNPIPGTTQRIWTWPRIAPDKYTAALANGLGGQVNLRTLADDTNKTSFAGSPTWDQNYPAAAVDQHPLFLPAGDGHFYAINIGHDRYYTGTAVVNGTPVFINESRQKWQYPDNTIAGGLGGALSTMGMFQLTGSTTKQLYFTCQGRVYSIPEVPALFSGSAQLSWVFPPGITNTNRTSAPKADPNDANTTALESTFTGKAPTLLTGVSLDGTPGNLGDLLYVVQDNSSVLALNASGYFINSTAPTSIVRASGRAPGQFNTAVSPIISQILPREGFSNFSGGPIAITPPDTQPRGTNFTAILFADSEGQLEGLNAQPNPDVTVEGPIVGTRELSFAYYRNDASGANRVASLSLVGNTTLSTVTATGTTGFNPVGGVLVEGDTNGQLRAYSNVTLLANGYNPYIGDTESRQGSVFGGEVSIDIRTVNAYDEATYNRAGIDSTTARTSAIDENGNPLDGSAKIVGGIGKQNALAVDWGGYINVLASGVFHAQPNVPVGPIPAATGTPVITVDITFSQAGQSPITRTVTLPAFDTNGTAAQPWTGGLPWPIDKANAALGHAFSIIGYNGSTGTNGVLTGPSGPNGGVFPWIAKYRFPIRPDANQPYAPGLSGYTISVRAHIAQAGVVTSDDGMGTQTRNSLQADSPVALEIGQKNSAGSSSLTNGFQTSVTKLGRPRPVYITNPIGLTVRGYKGDGASFTNLTGSNNYNVIGWAGPADGANFLNGDPGEALGNGFRRFDVDTQLSTKKAIYAPVGMIENGTSKLYSVLDNGGTETPGLYAIDRSDLFRTAGRALTISALSKPLRWNGRASSVMNPLPWEQFPDNDATSRDYPAIGNDQISLVTPSGQDAIHGSVSLIPSNPAVGVGSAREPQVTPLNLTVRVPRYQPANVNAGINSYKDPRTGLNYNFGSTYIDVAGFENGLSGSPIEGPLESGSGVATTQYLQKRFPAAGYMTELVLEANLPGAAAGGRRGGPDTPEAIFRDSTADGEVPVRTAYRALQTGLTVPPSVKLTVNETTIDLGKLPHGTGYSDINGNAFRVPYAPGFGATGTPWDPITDPATGNVTGGQLGSYFRPFTLKSDSNINLVDLRVAKMQGVYDFGGANPVIGSDSYNPFLGVNATSGNNPLAKALAFTSDQVNNLYFQTNANGTIRLPALSAAPYLGPGFTQGVGNIGIVTSFDHGSASNNETSANPWFNEQSLWTGGIVNNNYNSSAVTATGGALDPNNPTLLPTANNLNFGIYGWVNGRQPVPTLHKPLVSDAGSSIATIPDLAAPNVNNLPRISVAIPPGTPVGTYTTSIYPYEDNTPIQWVAWLQRQSGFYNGTATVGRDHDGVLNITRAGVPTETVPGQNAQLTLTVREARLTEGVTEGTLGQIDLPNGGDLLNTNAGFDALGANILPSAARVVTSNNANPFPLYLYWSTNRQPNNKYVGNNGLPQPNSPFSLAYTSLPSTLQNGLVDFRFSRSGTGATADARWWAVPGSASAYGLFPDVTDNTVLATLFPSTAAEATNMNAPFLVGNRATQTTRNYNPQVVQAINPGLNPTQSFVPTSTGGFLFWQGLIDKGQGTGQSTTTITDTRTFYTPLDPATGAPNTGIGAGGIQSLLNDPALPKLSPKPLLFSTAPVNGAPSLYLFWHAGNRSQTAIYYNVTSDGTKWGFTGTDGSDLKLPTPGSLVWQSDPQPVYRWAPDPDNSYTLSPAIDVFYTGVLKGRNRVETLMTRYFFNDPTQPVYDKTLPTGALRVGKLPPVVQEQLSSANGTTFAARDSSWFLGNGGEIAIYRLLSNGNAELLNGRNLNTSTNTPAQRGQLDQASGLVFYRSSLGGQIVVDIRSGTVTFPNIPPDKSDKVLVSYTPQTMRLNTTRNGSNVVAPYAANEPVLDTKVQTPSTGSAVSPVVFLDRGLNPRTTLSSPVVTSSNNMPLDRLWVLYRKSDPASKTGSGIYYKAMRLQVRLPRSVTLTNPDASGKQNFANLVVSGNTGPYEVNWAQGRIYFTEVDEGRRVNVVYNGTDTRGAANFNLNYTVQWGDEIPSSSDLTTTQSGNGAATVFNTTEESLLRTDSNVNEGQVSAFKDPIADKVWVFWTSTRASTTDLYYEAIAPLFYPTATNQQ